MRCAGTSTRRTVRCCGRSFHPAVSARSSWRSAINLSTGSPRRHCRFSRTMLDCDSSASRALASLVCLRVSHSPVSRTLRWKHRDGPCSLRHLPAAGLPAPTLQMEIPMGDNRAAALWIYDLFCTLLPKIQRLDLSVEGVGDVGTLLERLQSEVEELKNPVPSVAHIGAWSRRPAS